MIRANQVPAINGWRWVKSGVGLFRQQPALWLAMAFVYLALAILLGQIPFVGWLIVLALVTFGFGTIAALTMVSWSGPDATRLAAAAPVPA